QASYLPAGANSQRAQDILKHAFPHSYSQSTAVLVVTGPLAARHKAVANYSDFAAHRLRPAPFAAASDTLTPALRGALDSRDGAATLITLGWRQLDSSAAPGQSLTNLRAYIAAHPYAGVTAKVTGDVAINEDYQAQVNKSTNVTTIATVILVLAILLIVFRSVTLLVVPLLTILVSVLVSMGVVAELGTHGLIISSNTPIFMIVLLAGAGTDYCLFLASRFREELAAGKDPGDALIFTMTHVGEAIASSAAAVILGMGGMIFAQFGLFNTTGPAVAVSVAITLAAALTITPAMLRLLGRRAFWPARVEAARPARFWRMVARVVTTRPLTTILSLLVLLVPLNLAVLKTSQSFNFLGDLNSSVEARSAFTTVEAHYGVGNALPGTLVIQTAESLRTPAGLAALDRLDVQLAALHGIATVQGPTRPAGQPIPFQTYATNPPIAAALARNLSADGRTAQFTITTTADPYSQAARDATAQARLIGEAAFPAAAVFTSGASAASADIQSVISSDLVRIGIFVLGGILLVLVLLLRAIVAPIYLLASVLLSLGATVGATTGVFQGLGGQDGLVFWVPFLILTMLIGLSTDYNILLISRVREEARRGGDYRAAVAMAVERTGGIITTCGLVLAGSFGTLMLASVTGLRELGFAVAFGVLLDTLLLRTVLVPALVVLMGERSWFPGRLVVAAPQPVTAEQSAA
ncbi:MAG TPA: MMPL family transporter, partial [Chloroflexota bacterium]|nr:MMPL family transporter [Chloroflexota bacterium]